MKSHLALGLIGLTLAACARYPEKEIGKAKAALAEAQQAQAEVYAPEAYRKAEDLMAAVNTLIRQGNYSQAQETALEVRVKAAEARFISGKNREERKARVENMLNQTGSSLTKVKDTLNQLSSSPASPDELLALEQELTQAEAMRADIEKLLAEGSYAESEANLAELQAKIDSVDKSASTLSEKAAQEQAIKSKAGAKTERKKN